MVSDSIKRRFKCQVTTRRWKIATCIMIERNSDGTTRSCRKELAVLNDRVDMTDTRLHRLWRFYSRIEAFLVAGGENDGGHLKTWSAARILIYVLQLISLGLVLGKLIWRSQTITTTLDLAELIQNILTVPSKHVGMASYVVAHLPVQNDKWRPTWVTTATHQREGSFLGACLLISAPSRDNVSGATCNFAGLCSTVKWKPCKEMAQRVHMLDMSCM